MPFHTVMWCYLFSGWEARCASENPVSLWGSRNTSAFWLALQLKNILLLILLRANGHGDSCLLGSASQLLGMGTDPEVRDSTSVQLSEILTQADVPEPKYACAVLRNMCNYSYRSQRAWQPGDLYASQRVSSHLLIKQVLRVFGEEPALGSYQRTFS